MLKKSIYLVLPSDSMDDIRYIDRSSGQPEIEEVYGRRALSLFYGTSPVSRLFAFLFLPALAKWPFLSRFYGYLQKRPSSRKKIAPFLSTYRVNAMEFADPVESFSSFNDFFIRKLKLECRPIDTRANVAVLPADGRYLVFPDLSLAEGFYVKGQQFELPEFLQDRVLARRFSEGSMVIARLCPTDYHRFHFPVGGLPSKPKPIQGPLYSVNPIALGQRLSILCENKRVITEIETVHFGTVLMVEIGATFVGSIHQTYVVDQPVMKGDEKGYFAFGGSCIVLLFEKNCIVFDEDLVENSSRHIETKALFGTSLGRTKKM